MLVTNSIGCTNFVLDYSFHRFAIVSSVKSTCAASKDLGCRHCYRVWLALCEEALTLAHKQDKINRWLIKLATLIFGAELVWIVRVHLVFLLLLVFPLVDCFNSRLSKWFKSLEVSQEEKETIQYRLSCSIQLSDCVAVPESWRCIWNAIWGRGGKTDY